MSFLELLRFIKDPTTYGVWRVVFCELGRPERHSIALVPAENPYRGAGKLYQLADDPGSGTVYAPGLFYDFKQDSIFLRSVYQFSVLKSDLERFEEFAENPDPPHNTEIEDDSQMPVRSSIEWVDGVLANAKEFLGLTGPPMPPIVVENEWWASF
ncbi:hypothetical protein BDV28DRAFT_149133 [Aspergillus coremiiformis]|uniref:Uncharacterized protein n=1 Tax=Aspergillus coremiiformis TaxID=138285 RepID=A0A5N6Z3V6_9EURO|nr:hypothetical protein BDV28DRAFT_149133 [Aspergillus coremiiformis]